MLNPFQTESVLVSVVLLLLLLLVPGNLWLAPTTCDTGAMLAAACAGLAAVDWTAHVILGCRDRTNEALRLQVEALCIQVHTVEVGVASQQQKIEKLQAELTAEDQERKILREQVHYLDSRLQEEEQKQEQLTLCSQQECAMGGDIDNMCQELVEQLRETNRWLGEETRRLESLKLEQSRFQDQLESLVLEHGQLQRSYMELLDQSQANGKERRREQRPLPAAPGTMELRRTLGLRRES